MLLWQLVIETKPVKGQRKKIYLHHEERKESLMRKDISKSSLIKIVKGIVTEPSHTIAESTQAKETLK